MNNDIIKLRDNILNYRSFYQTYKKDKMIPDEILEEVQYSLNGIINKLKGCE